MTESITLLTVKIKIKHYIILKISFLKTSKTKKIKKILKVFKIIKISLKKTFYY